MIKEFKGAHRWLSNFAPCEVRLDRVIYPTTENAYQAAKTLLIEERKPFLTCTPGQAKKAGRTVTIQDDWDDVKLTIMEDLTRQKYSKEPFKSKLLGTGDIEIQEGNSWGDTFWGVCKGKGENNLGKIIMKIRSELQQENATPTKFVTQVHRQHAKVEKDSRCYVSVGTGFVYLGYEAVIIAANKNALRKIMSGLTYAETKKDKLKPFKLNKEHVYDLVTFRKEDTTALDVIKENNKRKAKVKR